MYQPCSLFMGTQQVKHIYQLHTHTHTCARTHAHIRTRTQIRTKTHTRTYTYTHASTHRNNTHTHTTGATNRSPYHFGKSWNVLVLSEHVIILCWWQLLRQYNWFGWMCNYVHNTWCNSYRNSYISLYWVRLFVTQDSYLFIVSGYLWLKNRISLLCQTICGSRIICFYCQNICDSRFICLYSVRPFVISLAGQSETLLGRW